MLSKSPVSRSVDRALQMSIVDGVLFALMLGVSESYFGACAVALGHGDTALALLATLPLFAGALAQAFTSPLVLCLGSRKRLVAAGALVQALSHLGLLAIALFALPSFWLLLALIILYYVSGMIIQPAWGAWMGELTERRDRERYFTLRSTCMSVSMLSAFLWAGYQLHDGAAHHDVSRTYAWLFGVGFLARFASSVLLHTQPDPLPERRDSLRRVLARTRSALRGNGFRVALILGAWMLGAHISIPFYAPYMLKTLSLGYEGFALVCAVQLMSKAAAFPFMRWVSPRLGLRRMLIASMGGAAVVALLWGTAQTITGLFFAQVLSGVAWAAYELSSFQLLLSQARPKQRVEFLAMAASFGGFMQLSGALLGSLLLARAHFSDVFIVSALARALPLLAFLPLAQVKRQLSAATNKLA
jgi:MFS family permease